MMPLITSSTGRERKRSRATWAPTSPTSVPTSVKPPSSMLSSSTQALMVTWIQRTLVWNRQKSDEDLRRVARPWCVPLRLGCITLSINVRQSFRRAAFLKALELPLVPIAATDHLMVRATYPRPVIQNHGLTSFARSTSKFVRIL